MLTIYSKQYSRIHKESWEASLYHHCDALVYDWSTADNRLDAVNASIFAGMNRSAH